MAEVDSVAAGRARISGAGQELSRNGQSPPGAIVQRVQGPFSRPRSAVGWRDPEHRKLRQSKWIRRGVPVELARGESARPFHHAPSRRMDEQQWELRKEERDRLLKMGAFVASHSQNADELVRAGHMISPAFLVPKKGKTNKWRLVIDQRRLNRRCDKKPVKFEGLDKLRFVNKARWAISWDLADGYMNLEIFPPHRKRMTVDLGQCMAADGEPISQDNPRFVECTAMPFGWLQSPWYFVKMMRVVDRTSPARS
eukprot:SAG31_NODE_4254_length_3414_cov_5.296833_3_plen_254_part_00